MKKVTQKSIVVLIGILTISLVAGNALFAGGIGGSGSGLVGDADINFVSNTSSSGSSATETRISNASSDLISAEDIEFAATPFNRTLVATGSHNSGPGGGLVGTADVNFARGGAAESDTANLVCVINGVQASGKICVN